MLLEKSVEFFKINSTSFSKKIQMNHRLLVKLQVEEQTQTAKRMFAFEGAQVFDKLPKDIR